MSLEHTSLEAGGPRIKFECVRVGCEEDDVGEQRRDLEAGLQALVASGAAPVGPDGKLLGNCACLIQPGKLLISRSGRSPTDAINYSRDFPVCVAFDKDRWQVEFRAESDASRPSSDTPLHWFSLVEAPRAFGWPRGATFVLHGHTFATSEEAALLGVPISEEETLFSTKEDVQALSDLLRLHPYPQHKVFIRKGHGFLILSETMQEAIDTLNGLLERKALKGARGAEGAGGGGS